MITQPKNDVLEIIDGIDSKASLARLLSIYGPASGGILVLITSTNNAMFLVTVKLKSRHNAHDEMVNNKCQKLVWST